MNTFIVTFQYLGNAWFLRAKSWTDEPERASDYATEEAASIALTRVRRYMRNKQVKARIEGKTPCEDSHRSTEASDMTTYLRTLPGRAIRRRN